MKNIIFRKIGGRIVPIRAGSGVRIVDPIMKSPTFVKDQNEMLKTFKAQQFIFKLAKGK